MLFDFAELAPAERYKLLASAIVPRPIAWVVTLDKTGRRNAAPFSFFNVFGEDPPVVCLGIGPASPGPFKDTGANIRATRQFVINLVAEAMMRPMHVTAIPFPPGVDEIEAAGLSTLPSVKVRPPRLAESPVALECELHTLVDLGTDRTLVVGQVLAMHVADEAVISRERCRLDPPRLGLVGRVDGPDGYVRTSGEGVFREARLTLEDWEGANRAARP